MITWININTYEDKKENNWCEHKEQKLKRNINSNANMCENILKKCLKIFSINFFRK